MNTDKKHKFPFLFGIIITTWRSNYLSLERKCMKFIQDNWNTILPILTAFLSAVVTFFSKSLYLLSVKRKEFKDEFIFLITDVEYCNLTKSQDRKLFYLREFFIKHPKLFTIKFNQEFFAKWLDSINSENDHSYWSKERINELRKDIQSLKIKY